jgi:diadenosine tetraphosphate (Ap4A) HIT family hydrolase
LLSSTSTLWATATLSVSLPTPLLSHVSSNQPCQLVIPKYHGAKLHDIPDDQLTEILPVAKKIAQAVNAQDYNILQNNGRVAHQVVDHVHFHVIPKPNEKEGLGISWPQQQGNQDKLKKLREEIMAKM